MVCIRNLKKNGNLLSCDYYPENKDIAGNIIVDIKTKLTVKHTIYSEQEFLTYSIMAKKRLLEFSETNELPNEAFCYWY